MRLHCRLREFRGERPLRALAAETGIHRGDLSRIERGKLLPSDEQAEELARVYGQPVERWYWPVSVLADTSDSV